MLYRCVCVSQLQKSLKDFESTVSAYSILNVIRRMTTEAEISCYVRNYSKVDRRRQAYVVFCVICVCLPIDVRLCSASPTAAGRLQERENDVKRALILERSPRSPGVTDPHEKCFETTCNRVTHYCDGVIR